MALRRAVTMDSLETEARLFTRYLIDKEANSQVIELYKNAMADSRPDETDQKLLKFMVAHPSSIGLIDAGLIWHNASSEARRRLYFMFAILEAHPHYHDLFLPKKRGHFYTLVILYSGVRAVLKAGLGLAFIKVIA